MNRPCHVAAAALLLMLGSRGLADPEAGTHDITLRVTLAPATITPADALVYTVTLKNATAADLPIYRTNTDDLRFVELASGTAWVTLASLLPPPPAAPPALTMFKAGQEWTHVVRLPPRTSFVPAGGKADAAREGLPPGRYRLEYSTTFIDHYPDPARKPAVWAGTLRAEPVAFEVKIAVPAATP